MPNKIKCPACKGAKKIEVLLCMHDNKKELIICYKCNGIGYINEFTEQEEDDYWHDWWS